MSRIAGPRRWGFKDSGGLTAAGDLPKVIPVAVENERALRDKVAKVIAALTPSTEWDRRIEALLQLEALVKGGAVQYDAFLELLRELREPLTEQLNDRRSAVSRAVCHVLGVLAHAYGRVFETNALHFLPELFKVLVISVQVMAHAADQCVRTILCQCHSMRLLPLLCSTACGDRNAKLRRCCCEYLLLILQEWEPVEYERCLGVLESAILSAAQDALADIRATARALFASLRLALPHRASALLSGLDLRTRDKLQLGPPPPVAPPGRASASSSAAVPARPSRGANRKSIGGAALRVALPENHERPKSARGTAADSQSLPYFATPRASRMPHPPPTPIAASVDRFRTGPTSVQRITHITNPSPGPSQAGFDGPNPSQPAWRVLSDVTVEVHVRDNAALPSVGAWRALRQPAEAGDGEGRHGNTLGFADRVDRVSTGSASSVVHRPIGELLQVLEAPGTDWKDKVEALQEVHACLESRDPATKDSLHSQRDSLAGVLLSHMREAHVRVATTCLAVASHALIHQPFLLKPVLEPMLALVFARACESNASIRAGASEVLAALPAAYDLPTVIGALLGALDRVRAPRMQCAVLEAFTTGVATPQTAALPQEAAHPLRLFLIRVLPLVLDKHYDVRRTAAGAVAAVHANLDADVLVTLVLEAAPPQQEALCKALQSAIPGITSTITSALRARGLSAYHLPQPGGSPSKATSSFSGIPAPPALHPGAFSAAHAGPGPSGPPQLTAHTSIHPPNSSPSSSCNAPVTYVGEGDAITGAAGVFTQRMSPDAGGAASSGMQGMCFASSRRSSPDGDAAARQLPGTGRSTPIPPNLDSDEEDARRDVGEKLRATIRTPSPSCLGNRTRDQEVAGGEYSPNCRPAAQHVATPWGRPDILGECSPTRHHRHHLALEVPSPKDKNRKGTPGSGRVSTRTPAQRLFSDISNLTLGDGPASPGLQAVLSPTRLVIPRPGSGARLGPSPHGGGLAELNQERLSDEAQTDALIASAAQGNPSALRGLAAASLRVDPAVWERALPDATAAVLSAMQHVDWAAREAAAGALRDVTMSHAHLLAPFLPRILTALVDACADDVREVRMAAEEAAEELLPRSSPEACLAVLATRLPAEGAPPPPGPAAAATIKLVRRAVSALSADATFAALLPVLLPGLFSAFNHPSADVRKGVVACLVDVWVLLGTRLDPLLKPLSSSQLKLLTIYMQRRQAGA